MNIVRAESEPAMEGMTRRRFLRGTGAAFLSMAIPDAFALSATPGVSSLLILGDSMALCGFGKKLDQLFRGAGVNWVNTYMACGTNPLSWLSIKPYLKARARCGFHKIESVIDGEPAVFQDTYGMRRGHRPSSHPVPKLETLIPMCRPEIVVVQLGNNLFDILKGSKHERMSKLLQPYIGPFLARLVGPESPVRRVYWVTPPVCKRIKEKSQDILVETIRSQNHDWLRVIDSRLLIKYPYSNLQPDKQHFFGRDMNIWAEAVFEIINKDLDESTLPPSLDQAPQQPVDSPPSADAELAPSLIARCRLLEKTEPFTLDEIAPYHESLVGYVYKIEEIYRGEYEGDRLVVLRPAHIDKNLQPLDQHQPSRSTTLCLIPLEETRWGTLKTKDPADSDELDRFLCEEDHIRLSDEL